MFDSIEDGRHVAFEALGEECAIAAATASTGAAAAASSAFTIIIPVLLHPHGFRKVDFATSSVGLSKAVML